MTLALVQAKEPELAYLARLSTQSLDSTLGLDALKGYLNQGTLFTLFKDAQPIGFLVQKIVLEEAELIQILVDPLYCGQGFANAALALWHQSVRDLGVCQIFLEVRQSNVPAVALYQRLGYRSVGIRKNYYRYADGLVDAWVMSLNFLPSIDSSKL
ncbi:ribosomal protein S18-alanine N-acetyltransferase [Reinekea sp.]|uniref:ribosomal protein S18-alanine N-acetyltransferase n=1 Tax=Reinekea sp. TaxID=1970455 RepID=UPI002A80E135|nr:ribosomal protein S18-alanine N-acetyltransferase [Reinekea sp.]